MTSPEVDAIDEVLSLLVRMEELHWHFEDGQLAGIQSGAAAVRALRERLLPGPDR
jgi:hypothetical protein